MKPLRYLCLILLAACAALAPPVSADPSLVSTLGVSAATQDAQTTAPALMVVEAPQAVAPAAESEPTTETVQTVCVAYVIQTTRIALVRPEVRASALRRA